MIVLPNPHKFTCTGKDVIHAYEADRSRGRIQGY